MKNHIKTILILVFILFSNSCSDDDMPHKPESSPFHVEFEGGINKIGAEGGTLDLKINAGTNGWWVVIPDKTNWCSVSKKFGSGDFILPITIQKNESGESRTTILSINPTFDLPALELTIIQD